MPTYTVVIVLAIAGALYLALMAAAARRWPGEGRWSELRQDQKREKNQYLLRLLRERLEELQDQKREALLLVLRARFGDLPPAVVARIESEDAEWCEEMLRRAATVTSLEELGF